MAKKHFKFPMHDMHFHKTMKILRNAAFLAILAPLCLYTFHNVPERNRYKAFYSSYDPIEAFDRMQTGGYLTSVPKDKN